MSLINRSTIEAVKSQLDIVDIIESYGTSLRTAGRNLVGLCPFHSENSPSFNVSREYQSYHCFGCGEKGDIINFVQEFEHISFVDAVRDLAEQAGVTIEESGERDPEWEKKKRYLDAYDKAGFFFRSQFLRLPEDHNAVIELGKRDMLGNADWREKFGIGYAPPGYTNLTTYLQSKGFSGDELVEFGLASKNEERGTYFDKYRDRLMWEIRDVRGNIIGFGGRKLHEEQNPKYLNTPQTILYHKSRVLYGLDLARKKIATEKQVFVVEGYTDVMAMHAIGVENVVASSGTAFSDGHTKMIRNLIDDMSSGKNGEFIFVFDGDKAGVKAALSIFNIEPSIKERSYVVPMDNGDPCDIRLRDGDDALRNALTHRVPLTEFVLWECSKSYDLTVAERREEYLREAGNILSNVSQTSLREEYSKKVALWTGTAMTDIRPSRPSSHKQESGRHRNTPARPTRDVFERRVVSAFLRHPEQCFDTVDRWGIDEFIKNVDYNNILFDGMSLAGAGEKFSAEDFSDRKLFIDLQSEPIESSNPALYIDRQFQVLQRINGEEANGRIRAEVAQKYRSGGQLSSFDLTKAFNR